MKKWRIPRKIKKRIPKGRYCYGFIGPISWNAKVWYCDYHVDIKIKDVPNKEYVKDLIEEYGEEKVEYCKILGCLIDDSCKGCGTKLKY